MKNYQYLFFDLDGTLTDPAVGITRCVAYALNYFGITVDDLTTLYPFIGPPLSDSLKEIYNFTEEQAQEGLLKYRERFVEKGIFENELYPGISELLEAAVKKIKKYCWQHLSQLLLLYKYWNTLTSPVILLSSGVAE